MTALEALLAYKQADEEGIMVLTSRQAIHEVADELRRLRGVAQTPAPVAWSLTWPDGEVSFTRRDPSENDIAAFDILVTPLYASPVSSTERTADVGDLYAAASGHPQHRAASIPSTERQPALISITDDGRTVFEDTPLPSTPRLCSCKASSRDGQHMAWCPAISSTNGDTP